MTNEETVQHVVQMLQAFTEVIQQTMEQLQQLTNEPKQMIETVVSDEKGVHLTLEDVRKIAAEKARDGYTDAVRELLGAYGVDKLSALDPANYAAFMSELEALGNGN